MSNMMSFLHKWKADFDLGKEEKGMKITITGNPKEIAALAVETQRRQTETAIRLRADRETEAHKALVKAIRVLHDVKFAGEDPAPPDSR